MKIRENKGKEKKKKTWSGLLDVHEVAMPCDLAKVMSALWLGKVVTRCLAVRLGHCDGFESGVGCRC